MRLVYLVSIAFIITVGGLVACNSNDRVLSQTPSTSPTPKEPPSTPADSARRISAAELHTLFEKNDVVIIDTRAESAYKDEHIKGAISMPAGTVLGRIDELPRNKMIVAYCT